MTMVGLMSSGANTALVGVVAESWIASSVLT